jgi:type IV pilus assembly protein PilA
MPRPTHDFGPHADFSGVSPRRHRRSTTSEEGFTLIELLVTILIMGILAAITIPSMVGQRHRARDAEAKTFVKMAFLAAETYYLDNDQSYTGLTRQKLITVQPELAEAPFSGNWCHEGGNQGLYGNNNVLCIAMASRGTPGQQFEFRRDPGYAAGVARVCSIQGKSGCVAGGAFGYGRW